MKDIDKNEVARRRGQAITAAQDLMGLNGRALAASIDEVETAREPQRAYDKALATWQKRREGPAPRRPAPVPLNIPFALLQDLPASDAAVRKLRRWKQGQIDDEGLSILLTIFTSWTEQDVINRRSFLTTFATSAMLGPVLSHPAEATSAAGTSVEPRSTLPVGPDGRPHLAWGQDFMLRSNRLLDDTCNLPTHGVTEVDDLEPTLRKRLAEDSWETLRLVNHDWAGLQTVLHNDKTRQTCAELRTALTQLVEAHYPRNKNRAGKTNAPLPRFGHSTEDRQRTAASPGDPARTDTIHDLWHRANRRKVECYPRIRKDLDLT